MKKSIKPISAIPILFLGLTISCRSISVEQNPPMGLIMTAKEEKNGVYEIIVENKSGKDISIRYYNGVPESLIYVYRDSWTHGKYPYADFKLIEMSGLDMSTIPGSYEKCSRMIVPNNSTFKFPLHQEFYYAFSLGGNKYGPDSHPIENISGFLRKERKKIGVMLGEECGYSQITCDVEAE